MSKRPPIDHKAIRRWTHTGLECVMVDSESGWINGYVRLPRDHVGFDSSYNTLNRTISVHGGLTYGTDEDGWVGFDTAHGGDYWPGLEGSERLLFNRPAERVWSLERLADEVNSLAEQLADLTEFAEPTDVWDCTDAEFRTLRRQARAWRRLRDSLRRCRMTWREDTGSHTEEGAGRWARAHAEDDWPIEDHSAPTGDALARLRRLEAALVEGAW